MLEKYERDLFFRVWLGLLSFVNKRYTIDPLFGHPQRAGAVNSKQTVYRLRNKLWENDSIIDDYMQENDTLKPEHKDILHGWKHNIKNYFVIMHYFRRYTVLGDIDNNIYGVLGITHPIDGLFDTETKPPIVIHTVLLPFRNKIIYDSFVTVAQNSDKRQEEAYRAIYEKTRG
jgi:hypothetical protein